MKWWMPGYNEAHKRYQEQKAHANQRSIQFLLTFDEWWMIWDGSGHWHERGQGKKHYVMARFCDSGPYSVDNVKIVTGLENSAQAYSNKPSLNRSRPPIQFPEVLPDVFGLSLPG